MELNIVTLELLILALPGVIWTQIDAANRHSSQSGQFMYVVRCFMFGMISYLIVMFFYKLFGVGFNTFNFAGDAMNTLDPVDDSINFDRKIDELLWALPTAVLGGLAFVFLRTKGVIQNVLNALRISDYSGCEDIFEYTLSPLSKVGLVVHVRDFKEQVTYSGTVKAFSDRTDLREILLGDVVVTDFAGLEMYSIPNIYISRPITECVIEFPEEAKDDQQEKRINQRPKKAQ